MKDFIGQDLQYQDTVVFVKQNTAYRSKAANLALGKVVSITPKTVLIETDDGEKYRRTATKVYKV